MKTLIVSLLFVVEIFANVSVMQQFPNRLTPEDYKILEKQGITTFKYYSCYDTGFKYKKDIEGHSYLSENILVKDDVKIAHELLRNINACISYKDEIDRCGESEDSNKKLANLLKKLDDFFITHKNLKDLNIIQQPVNVFFKNNEWYCEDEVDPFDVHQVFYDGYKESLEWIYSIYKERFEKILNKRSFTMFALLAEDQNIPSNNVEDLNNYCAANYVDSLYFDTYLLETLIKARAFQVIKHYKKILTNNYAKNPFAVYKSRRIALMREIGFEFLRYSENISDKSIKHDDDNLYLAIKRQFTVSDEELLGLIDNIPKNQNIFAYLDYAIDSHHETAFQFLLARYPKILNSKKEVSEYLLYLLKNTTNDDIIEIFIATYPYDTYDVIIDPETEWNALDYAKQSRYGNEKSIKLLEEHGFKSHFLVDIKRNIDYFHDDFFAVMMTIFSLIIYTFPMSGVAILGLAIFIYIIIKGYKKYNPKD